MFVVAVLVYPVVLGLLCLGAGLLVDRCGGGRLPGMLLPAVGAALLIGVSQWTTYAAGLARLTPAAFGGVAAAGWIAGRRRARTLSAGWRGHGWAAAALLGAYAAAAAPVALAGRVTFAAYNVLPDSALHLIGADHLIRFGQRYAHLDLGNSYGRYIAEYFANSYPSGAHTLFGGSAFLVGVPLIWALQPFCAFVLALSAGPAWVLAERLGLRGPWAGLAALTAAVPALVYGYGLVASIKELVALPMILTLGALVAGGRGWVGSGPRSTIPFGLVVGAGLSAVGAAFGAWAAAAAVVLAGVLVGEIRAGGRSVREAAGMVGMGVGAAVVAAWPTWVNLPASLTAAGAIASTSNPGNLDTPLRPVQVLGAWLARSYSLVPEGAVTAGATRALLAATGAAALVGAVHVLRLRAWALAAWIGLELGVWVGLTSYGETWTDAKTLMLTSPVVLLLAWAGVAGLRGSRARWLGLPVGLAIAGGVLYSDFVQYHDTDLAPTARYAELASVSGRFGSGPTLFPDFDEWSLYVLRGMDVGGLDFVARPRGLEAIVANHGDPADLDLVPPGALRGYPVIVTGRDPTASRPAAAYALAWTGTYYQVWVRRPGAPAALAHLGVGPGRGASCPGTGLLAALAREHRARLVAAFPAHLVAIDLARARHPTWQATSLPSLGLVMRPDGRLEARFVVPRSGRWNVWIQGEVMPEVDVGIDGRRVARVRGQVRGSVYNPDTLPPVSVELRAGSHTLSVTRGGAGLGPGDAGSAVLHAIVLTRGAAGPDDALRVIPPAGWRSLCGRRVDWVEAVPGGAAAGVG